MALNALLGGAVQSSERSSERRSEIRGLRAWPNWAGAALAAFGFALCVAVFYPGIFTPDSLAQFDQARSGQFEDWHPPIMAALWFVFERIHDGPEPLFLAHLLLFWVGLWAVS